MLNNKPGSETSQCQNDTKKAGGSGLDHPIAVNSNGKIILTVCMSICLSACMCEYARASKSVRGCLLAFLSSMGEGGGVVYYFL